MIFFCFWPVSRPFGLSADEGSLHSPIPDIASRLGEVFRAPKGETYSNGHGLAKDGAKQAFAGSRSGVSRFRPSSRFRI